MKFYARSFTSNLFYSVLVISTLFFISCSQPQSTTPAKQKIKESEIVQFQKDYTQSFNAISYAARNGGDVELAAKNHIEKNYGFDMGKVLFKLGDTNKTPFRSTYDGLLSMLISENTLYPEDEGYALNRWHLIEWKNHGIINDDYTAIAMGHATMTNAENENSIQNFTMCFSKDSNGDLKLIGHKISKPCD